MPCGPEHISSADSDREDIQGSEPTSELFSCSERQPCILSAGQKPRLISITVYCRSPNIEEILKIAWIMETSGKVVHGKSLVVSECSRGEACARPLTFTQTTTLCSSVTADSTGAVIHSGGRLFMAHPPVPDASQQHL